MSSISPPSSWVIRDQVPFDIFIPNVAFTQIPTTIYDSPEQAIEDVLETVEQFIERCKSPTEEEERLQKQMPTWFYIPFCEMLFNNNVSPGHCANTGFIELPEWKGEEGQLKDCWPYASLVHFHLPMTLADLIRLPEIPIDNMLLPLFFPSNHESPVTTTTTGAGGPIEAQNKFARHILTNTPRNFLITMVIKEDASLQLWYHTKMRESIPSTFISFKDPQNVMPLYRLMWRLASMPYERQFGF